MVDELVGHSPQPPKGGAALAGRVPAPLRLAWPSLVRHSPTMSHKRMPIGRMFSANASSAVTEICQAVAH